MVRVHLVLLGFDSSNLTLGSFNKNSFCKPFNKGGTGKSAPDKSLTRKNTITYTSVAIQKVKDELDFATLKDISEHGCASVAPSGFIYYHETSKFFDTHEEGIEDFFSEIYGEDEWLSQFTKDVTTFHELKNNIVWAFIEQVAHDEIESLLEDKVLFTLPTSFAPVLINDDWTGLTCDDVPLVKEIIESEFQGLSCVDVWNDESFVTYHDAKSYGWLADECVTFVFVKVN